MRGAVGWVTVDAGVTPDSEDGTSMRRFPPAPVDQDELAESLRAFGHSVMLPCAAYTDPAVFAWEREHLFGGGWMCAGRSSQLPRPGDQRAEAAGAGSVLLVRGEDGSARAFANTCRHRGHELLPCGAAASRPAIICPYHAWTYALDGGLRHAAGMRELPGWDAGQWGLKELPLTEWHGLIFADTSGGQAGSMTAALAGLAELLAPYEPGRLVTAATHVYDAAANWKILTENYHECYHCPAIHPELCRVSPPKSGVNYAAGGAAGAGGSAGTAGSAGAWIGGRMDLRDGMTTMSLTGESGGVPLRGLSGAQLRTVIYVNIFPNVLLSLHPDYVMTHRLVPIAADRTRIECSWAFAPEAVQAPGFSPGYAAGFWDLTNRQDWAACESVQRGLSSRFAAPGPLSPAEDAVYSFVTTIARAYRGEPVV